MITQYPDHITVAWQGEPIPIFVLDELGEPTNVPTGDYLSGETQTFESDCRVEANSRAKKIVGTDGSLIEYAFDVYMPMTDVEIPAFIADYVLNSKLTGKIKLAKNNQFNSRIWL